MEVYNMYESIIAALGTIIAAGIVPVINMFNKNKELKKELKELLKVIEYDAHSNGLMKDLIFLTQIKDTIETVLKNTSVDRFLILLAINKETELRFASAMYEQHKDNPKIMLSIGATGKYKNFEFDPHYRQMLKDAKKISFVDYTVEEMPPSDLKEIYLTEGIKHSRVMYLINTPIDESKDGIFYCTFATHNNEPFSPRDKSIIKSNGDTIKSLFREQEEQRVKEKEKTDKEIGEIKKLEEKLK